MPTENMEVNYIWIHCNLVYVRWAHEIFVKMKYSAGQEAGSEGIMLDKQ